MVKEHLLNGNLILSIKLNKEKSSAKDNERDDSKNYSQYYASSKNSSALICKHCSEKMISMMKNKIAIESGKHESYITAIRDLSYSPSYIVGQSKDLNDVKNELMFLKEKI